VTERPECERRGIPTKLVLDFLATAHKRPNRSTEGQGENSRSLPTGFCLEGERGCPSSRSLL